jgi:hypothetical protein
MPLAASYNHPGCPLDIEHIECTSHINSPRHDNLVLSATHHLPALLRDPLSRLVHRQHYAWPRPSHCWLVWVRLQTPFPFRLWTPQRVAIVVKRTPVTAVLASQTVAWAPCFSSACAALLALSFAALGLPGTRPLLLGRGCPASHSLLARLILRPLPFALRAMLALEGGAPLGFAVLPTAAAL